MGHNGAKAKIVLLIMNIVFLTNIFSPGTVYSGSGMRLSEKYKSISNSYIDLDSGINQEPYYYSVMQDYDNKGYRGAQNQRIVMDSGFITDSSSQDIPVGSGIGGNENKVLLWNSDQEWFEWSFNIQEDGLYEMEVEYYPLDGTSSPAKRTIMIDGEIPFFEASNIEFPRLWTDDGEPKVNNIGDEVRPRQKEIRRWVNMDICDSQGMYSEPFKFYFTEGEHKLRLVYVEEPVAIGNITIKSPEIIPEYKEVKAQYEKNGYKNATREIKFQAESSVVEKNSATIRRESDADPMTEPSSEVNRKLNVIGDWRWKQGNQSITWKFSVPETGLYKIGLRVAQWFGNGLPVYRQIMIDGEIPFSEMKEYKFTYLNSWRTEVLQDDEGNPYLFYLTEGEHELTMTVKTGPLRDVIFSLYDDTLLLSKVIRQIIMLTGINPDVNYEYDLHKNIPDLIDNLKYLSESMSKKEEFLTGISSKKPPLANNLAMISDQLDNMIRKPDSIPRRLEDINNALSTLGTLSISLKDHPLTIDYFMVGPGNQKWKNAVSNIFQHIKVTWNHFLRSFTKDYDSVGSVYINEDQERAVLNVWVSRGREWAELIKEMADEDFTPTSGIEINLNVLPASQLNAGAVNALLLAICSGRAPDVACSVSSDSPVEFAIRDAVVDLSQFDDFDEVSQRFIPKILIPFQYRDGIYALPETMGFSAMFYRKDIIQELGLELPDTWEDVYEHVLPILYQHGMEFYYNGGLTPFLFQYGENYYRDNGLKSALDSPLAYQAFREYTELYTNYSIPVSANFFNRMRQGEMPIGIGDYGLYVQLSVAAPELTGRWGIAPVPGHRKEDGTIDRSVGGIVGEADIIMSQSQHKEEAWEFLKWWTSTETQERFGKEMEAYMGVQARWNTANIQAFKRLPWNSQDLKVIEEQLQWANETPVVLGGYFTGRHVSNAWNRVVLESMNVRDSLEKAVKDINKELKRKQEEYGINLE